MLYFLEFFAALMEEKVFVVGGCIGGGWWSQEDIAVGAFVGVYSLDYSRLFVVAGPQDGGGGC